MEYLVYPDIPKLLVDVLMIDVLEQSKIKILIQKYLSYNHFYIIRN